MSILTMVLMLVSVQDVAIPSTETWPQWRGPTADSVAPGRNLPMTWSKTDNIAWKTPLPGWGTSTPAIWKDAVFVTTQVDDRKLLVYRLDAKTGKVVWQREVGEGEPRRKGPVGVNRFHDEHNMASPSPVTDGKHVWVHFGNGDLACYDFDGNKVWSKNLGKEHGVYSIWWGHANSPVLVGDLLICVCMQDPKGGGKVDVATAKNYIVALDKLTGKQKWYTPRDYGAERESADSYTTPLLFDNKGHTELIVFGANVLDAYDPATGKRLWMCKPFTGDRVISGPTLVGDTVYAVQGMKGPVFAIKAGGSDDTTATNVRWKYSVGKITPDAASPVFANGLVFLANNDGIATCLDAKDGKEMWKERFDGEKFRATPLVADGKIYFFTKAGKAIIVEASREFKVLQRNDLGEDLMASPAAAHGSLFIRTKEHVYRIGGAK